MPQPLLPALRQWMAGRDIQALYLTIGDLHNNEYTAPHWQCLRHFTGFSGSAGRALVTADEALLWTDSRYWLQAAEELTTSGFKLMKEGAAGVPTPLDWLKSQATPQEVKTYRLALPIDMITTQYYTEVVAAGLGAATFYQSSELDALWPDRPPLRAARIDVQPAEWVGETVEQRLAILHEYLCSHVEQGGYVVADLSDIAWVLNLRGGDVACNPIFSSWLYWSARDDRFTLYVATEMLTPAARRQCEQADVQLRPYAQFFADIQADKDMAAPLHYDYETGSAALLQCGHVSQLKNPIAERRMIKTAAEQAGFREAMARDGVAMVQFLRHLDEAMALGEPLTEVGVDRILTELRSRQPGFEQPSFPTIAGYAAHGAIVHYEADEASDAALSPESLLLLDSGGQYDCGTTDITRTLSLGALTDEERRVYTLVLKGHLALQRQQFPAGTTGLQLDLAARSAMWNAGYDFGHGTGHGVGAHLCVHEGPQQIRKDLRPATLVPFRAGMTITDEPGIYVEGRFGVRIENTLLVVEGEETLFGHFLRFEPLTLCPYDLRPVDRTMLTAEEVAQINQYHTLVAERLMPRLAEEADRKWLEEATRPIS